MAIFHMACKMISRSSGRSAVAASAYRSGEKIHDQRLGQTYDYSRKSDVSSSEILAPDNAPGWVSDRGRLWNKVEATETRKNSQTAREIEVSLPVELSIEQRQELVRGFVQAQFIKHGLIADIAYHKQEADSQNPHAHIMLTTRNITPNGFGQKQRWMNGKAELKKWRENWAGAVNQSLSMNGHERQIDHRSHKERGLSQIPTIHIGVDAAAMERKGIKTDAGNVNRRIQAANAELADLGQRQQAEQATQQALEQERQEQEQEAKKIPDESYRVLAENLAQELPEGEKITTPEIKPDPAKEEEIIRQFDEWVQQEAEPLTEYYNGEKSRANAANKKAEAAEFEIFNQRKEHSENEPCGLREKMGINTRRLKKWKREGRELDKRYGEAQQAIRQTEADCKHWYVKVMCCENEARELVAQREPALFKEYQAIKEKRKEAQRRRREQDREERRRKKSRSI